MDGLGATIETAARAVAAASLDADRRELAALRCALALRRFAATTDSLIRLFGELSVRRDHPAAPKTLAAACAARENAEQVFARARSDARSVEAAIGPVVALLFASGMTDAGDEVTSARDALLASLGALAAIADDVADVMLIHESDLDPDNAGPPVPLDEVLAKLPHVA